MCALLKFLFRANELFPNVVSTCHTVGYFLKYHHIFFFNGTLNNRLWVFTCKHLRYLSKMIDWIWQYLWYDVPFTIRILNFTHILMISDIME
jgi:hypothetical protein